MNSVALSHRVAAPYNAVASTAVFLLISISPIVAVEPAPYDLALIAIATVFFISGLRIPGWVFIPLLLLTALLVFSLIGATHIRDINESARHVLITGYLCISTIFIGSLVARNPEQAIKVIFRGYAVAVLITGAAALIGYFSLVGGAFELFTENARARGTFKDPNVFGPFFVAPALYAFFRLSSGAGLNGLLWIFILLLSTVCVLLSFSRGAWGHYVLSFGICLFLLYVTSTNPMLKKRIVLVSSIAGVLSVVAFVALLGLKDVSELLSARFQLLQSYDLGDSKGRFNGQLFALAKILEYPLGLGYPGFQFLWGQAPHNVYLLAFLVGGWLGGVCYLLLIGTTLVCGLKAALMRTPVQGISIVLISTFIGLAGLGLLIDTDHWRHFYLVMGALWGCISYTMTYRPPLAATPP